MTRISNDILFDEKLRSEGKVQVFLDDRELNGDAVRGLRELGAVLKTVRLAVGDFVLSERVAVERKTSSDFESSIIDGRLFAQCAELKEKFGSPLIALVGSDFERIKPNALRGAFIALAVDYKIPLFFFDTEDELAAFLYALGEREQLKPRNKMKLQFEKRCASLADYQQLVVESLPLIGPVTAKNLLNHFGSVQAIANAGEKELRETDGVGEVRAKEIKRVLSTKYGWLDEEGGKKME